MKWVKIDGKCVLTLDIDEVNRLAEILKTKESVLEARYRRYQDKIDGGNGTDKDADKMYDALEDLELVKFIIELSKK